MVLTKSKQDTSGIPVSLKNHCITTQDTVKLLGITIDCRMSFEKHLSGLCKTAASQLSAFKRLRSYIPYEKTRKTLVLSFVLSHFNCCPRVWYFTTAKQLQKIEKIQERALRFKADDYETPYEMLMTNTETTTMRAKQMQTLCVDLQDYFKLKLRVYAGSF